MAEENNSMPIPKGNVKMQQNSWSSDPYSADEAENTLLTGSTESTARYIFNLNELKLILYQFNSIHFTSINVTLFTNQYQ